MRRAAAAITVMAALSACEPVPADDQPPGQTVLPAWRNRQRLPTSSHLRAVRFISRTEGYVAGEDTAIFRTSDGGATWIQLEHAPAGRGGDVAAMDVFAGGGTVHVGAAGADAASGGRWWTSGDGINFATPDQDSTGFAAMTSVDLVAPGTAYYLAVDGMIRHVTPSSVKSFSVGAPAAWMAVAFPGTGGVGYAAGSGGAIRKTTTNGSSWSGLASGTTADLRRLWFVSETLGYACGDAGKVIKTTDGTAWVDVSVGEAVTLRGICFADALTGWVVGDGGFIRRTVDGGATWTAPAAAVPTSFDLHDVWFVDASAGYAVGDYGTVLKTLDGGGHWTEISRGSLVRLNAMAFTGDGVKGLAVGGGGVILRTLDGGLTWGSSPSGVAVDLFGVSVPRTGSGSVAYACGAGGTILKTTDFGAGWAKMDVGSGATLRAILFPAGDTYGFCVGDGSTILHTSTGVSWTPQASPLTADFCAVSAPFTGLTAYAAGTAGAVVYTETGGAFWYDRSIGVPAAVLSLQSPMGSAVYAAASDGKIYRSFLYGQIGSWQALSPPSAANAIAFTAPAFGWCVGPDGVFYTEDGGSGWTRSFEHTKWTLRAVWMGSGGVGFAAGDRGTVLGTLTGGK